MGCNKVPIQAFVGEQPLRFASGIAHHDAGAGLRLADPERAALVQGASVRRRVPAAGAVGAAGPHPVAGVSVITMTTVRVGRAAERLGRQGLTAVVARMPADVSEAVFVVCYLAGAEKQWPAGAAARVLDVAASYRDWAAVIYLVHPLVWRSLPRPAAFLLLAGSAAPYWYWLQTRAKAAQGVAIVP